MGSESVVDLVDNFQLYYSSVFVKNIHFNRSNCPHGKSKSTIMLDIILFYNYFDLL